MSPSNPALTLGTPGLMLAYAAVLVFVIAGLLHGRAPLRSFLSSPLVAIPATLVAALILGLGHAVLPLPGEGLLAIVSGIVTCAAVGYATGRLIGRRRRPLDTSYRRGARVADAAGERQLSDHAVTLAGLPVAPQDETKHFKLIGSTGTGKSTAIREMLRSALARGDRAVIADPDGGYLDTFYDADRGDVILNPFEPAAAKWNLFGEITSDHDVDQLARSLIPDSGEPDRIWSEYARTFFIAVTQQAMAAGIQDDAELYRLLHVTPVKDLRVLLAGTAAGPFLEEGNEKMFGSVRSVASSAVRALKYTTRQQGTPFSVRAWVRNGSSREIGGPDTGPPDAHAARRPGPRGVLFFPYRAGEIAALRSIISAWMRIAIFEAMNREEGDQRLWFIVDELDALGEIDGLKDALARLRKFGGRCVLGFQSIAQVSGTYGRGIADTIVENCGNTLILRCSASERGGTSEFASKLIGQREILHTTHARSRRPTDWLASTTSSEQIRIEPAIMASEIERLPDLAGFLKFASIPDWKRVTLTPASDPRGARARRPHTGTTPAVPPTAPGTVGQGVPAAGSASAAVRVGQGGARE